MKYLKYCTINNVGGVRVVKHCTVLPIKDQRLCMLEVSKVVFVALHNSIQIYRVILLMSKVSKVHRELSIQSYVTYVKGVESSSIYTIRAVMLYMSKVSKEV